MSLSLREKSEFSGFLGCSCASVCNFSAWYLDPPSVSLITYTALRGLSSVFHNYMATSCLRPAGFLPRCDAPTRIGPKTPKKNLDWRILGNSCITTACMYVLYIFRSCQPYYIIMNLHMYACSPPESIPPAGMIGNWEMDPDWSGPFCRCHGRPMCPAVEPPPKKTPHHSIPF